MTSNEGGFLEGKEIVLKGRDVKILGILKSSEVNFDIYIYIYIYI
jgi:hypothetical protein